MAEWRVNPMPDLARITEAVGASLEVGYAWVMSDLDNVGSKSSWIEVGTGTGCTAHVTPTYDYWLMFCSTALVRDSGTSGVMLIDLGFGATSGTVTQVVSNLMVGPSINYEPIWLPVRFPANEKLWARGMSPHFPVGDYIIIQHWPVHGDWGYGGHYAGSEALVINNTYYGVDISTTSADTYTGWTQLVASTSRDYKAWYPMVTQGSTTPAALPSNHAMLQIGFGAASSEKIIRTTAVHQVSQPAVGNAYMEHVPYGPVIPAGTRIAARLKCSAVTDYSVTIIGFY